MRSTRSRAAEFRHRERDDHGASMVEFALILPLMVMFLLAIFSAGAAINSDIKLNQALRDSARYGSRLDPNNYTNYTQGSWAANTVSLAQQRYTGLTGSDATLCVAAVLGQGDGSVAVYQPSSPTAVGYSGTYVSNTNGDTTDPCWAANAATDGVVAGQVYIQVNATKQVTIDYFVGKQTITLQSKVMMPAEWSAT